MLKVVELPPEADLLPDGSKPGGWYRQLPDGRLLCELCPRACKLHEGDRGFCFVRQNTGGQIVLTTYGRSTGFCIDPIEKKPLNHFYPGTSVLSFGTAGCNLGCKFCQNWDISKSREIERLSETAMPDAIVAAAKRYGCRSVAFTYNDPVIWAEYAIDTAKLCRAEGIKTVAVTAGYITPQARGPFYEYMDAANVDLKGFTEFFYQHYTLSHLQPVLDTLEWLKKESSVWFEVTNLVIPRANDSPDEIRQMCRWILQHLGDDVPVHFTAFHPDFRLLDRPRTPKETLLMAYQIAKEEGLKYIYVGNVDDWKHQSTYCHNCGKLLIARNWYELGEYHLVGNRCEFCNTEIPGRFDHSPGDWGRRRMPVRIADFRVPPVVNLKTFNQASNKSAATASTSKPSRNNLSSGSRQQNRTAHPGEQAHLVPQAVAEIRSDADTASSNARQTHPNRDQHQEQDGEHDGGRTQAAGGQSPLVSQAHPPGAAPAVNARQQASVPRRSIAQSRIQAMTRSEGIFQLSCDQQAAILKAACEVVAAEIVGRQVAWRDPTLAGAADCAVEGLFVTLKRAGRLRACCGTLGAGLRLDQALRQAAARSATQDVRLPMIGVSELPYLSVDVTILHGFRLLPQDADQRRAAVQIGRHGLQIHYGPAAGLLLPHVATEHGWDVEEFFEHVSLKAGLPPTAWQDPSAELYTFEGYMVQGEFDPLAARFFASMADHGFDGTLLGHLVDAVRHNVWAGLAGATPTYYLPHVPDRTVHGVAVSVDVNGRTEPWRARISTRPGLPLQATLYQLAADIARSFAPMSGVPTGVKVRGEVAVLEDLQVHGTLAEPDLRGFDPARRLLLLATGGRQFGLYDPTQKTEHILDFLVEEAQVGDPQMVSLTSFLASTTAPTIRLSAGTKPHSQFGSRPPAVAGSFYPAEPQRLRRLLDQLVPAEPPQRAFWPAAMTPHAGLVYSGRIAAQVWQRLEIPDTVVIICPKHTRWGADFAVAPHSQWQLPGQVIEGNVELARRLAENVRRWQLDAKAHQHEHAIEVELPFVARFAPHARVVGVAIGPCTYEEAAEFAVDLAKLLRNCQPRPVLIISSDMNHYADDEENRRRDRLALQAMASLQPRRLYDTVRQHDISMCGIMPAVIIMETLRQLGGLRQFLQVAYGTSGDVSGDRSRVVGYAGVLLA